MINTLQDCVSIKAQTLIQNKGFNYDSALTLVVSEITKDNAREVKSVLMQILGDQQVSFNGQPTTIKDFAETDGVLECLPIDYKNKSRFNFIDLYRIFKVLRSENGCEWDKAQTHESIRKNAIEEAYELVEAINNHDIENMREETGDVFLQAMFHSVIGEEEGEFDLQDVISALCNKLITRHTHIFGEDKATNAAEALVFWERAKIKEKKYGAISDKLNGIAKALPALMRAKKIVSVARKQNLNFKDDNFEKISSLCAYFKDEEDYGNLLLQATAVLAERDIDAETALINASERLSDQIKQAEQMGDDISLQFDKLGKQP